MKTKKQHIEKINQLINGETISGDTVPLFWEKQGEYYVSGLHRLNEAQFQKLTLKYPCYL